MNRSLISNLTVQCFLFLIPYVYYLPFNIINIPIKPHLVMISIFYFSILEHTRPHKIFLIVLGIFDDIMSNTLIGLSSLQYVIIQSIASANRKALCYQTFNIVWPTLCIAIAICIFIKLLFLHLFGYETTLSQGIMIEYFVTVLFYPTIHLLYSLKINWFSFRNA